MFFHRPFQILFLSCILSITGFGQSTALPVYDDSFSDCAAILYKGEMLVDTYSPDGKCKLETGMTGKISVATVSLSEEGGIPTKEIGFKVAIKNTRTNTLLMYSDDTFFEVELEDLLKACGKDDHLIFITVDRKYALTHHEVEVIPGC